MGPCMSHVSWVMVAVVVVGQAWALHDGALEPAQGPRGHHHGLQLPLRRLLLERCAEPGVRQHQSVEAGRVGLAHGHRLHQGTSLGRSIPARLERAQVADTGWIHTPAAVVLLVRQIVQQVLEETGHSPALASLVCGRGGDVGAALIADRRMELVSFTGSTKVGE